MDIPIREAIMQYDFSRAEELLHQKISLLERKRKPTEREDSLLEVVQKNNAKMHATERVVVIDSVVLPKSKLLGALTLGPESGTVDTYEHYFGKKDAPDCMVFENQLKNRIVFSAQDKAGVLKLYESVRNDDEWSPPSPLRGIDNDDEDKLNYPFMLSDGQTLYFAAQNGESLGGYDIYMTRYDSEERRYLTPENVGMPFNSPANDYLLVIDEFNNLGWFATDRNQPEGSVCLYTFIPNETRKTYGEGTVDEEQLGRLARIARIQDTWTDRKAVDEARKRLASLRKGKARDERKRDFYFVVNDRHVCQTLDDFRNDKAREMMTWLLESRKEAGKTASELQGLRDRYAQASQADKAALAPQIRILEAKEEQLKADLKKQEKLIRKTELSK
ncbi:MAG TPA: hypothetical protein DC006_03850 [Prevotellaceae bacterium]|nr:hypothetical protein [Prevotellaceae bacterium]HBE54705.1 hypothetical protein [Prevotellaceae bacterium]